MGDMTPADICTSTDFIAAEIAYAVRGDADRSEADLLCAAGAMATGLSEFIAVGRVVEQCGCSDLLPRCSRDLRRACDAGAATVIEVLLLGFGNDGSACCRSRP